MKSLAISLLLLVGVSDALFLPIHKLDDVETTTTTVPTGYADRQCDSDLENLWLDVVVVVDNSHGMTSQGLTQVDGNIATVFGYDTRIGVRDYEPKTTRVGLVSYNADAKILAGLDTYQSYDDLANGVFDSLNSVSATDESYLAKGLSAAEKVFEEGKSTANRTQYKKVVIVYASSYKGTGELNPVPVADRMKTAGVKIITVAFSQNNDDGLLKDLSEIASLDFDFANTDKGVVEEIQGAMLRSNCFCPNGWTQYRESYPVVDSYPYGVCISATVIAASWKTAQLSCRNQWNHAYLVNEYNINKHNYIIEFLQNNTAFSQPYTYHIGLSYSSGTWKWDQPFGISQLPIQEWSYWSPGFPKTDSTLTGVTNVEGQQNGWENVNQQRSPQMYICEVASCDTKNFCAQIDSVF
ncbi:hypothetical protein CRE_01843 [Caenorhabditis remanei]|uniref:Uncharacterized protein n=1 Tax=Caenorhabditis remanei TaxID=31234 RepID=E3LFS4_CAERE|nr:hypothetical protein CRE_01843 [Caenorhabditis remanei]